MAYIGSPKNGGVFDGIWEVSWDTRDEKTSL
jgi:hypothetical protein